MELGLVKVSSLTFHEGPEEELKHSSDLLNLGARCGIGG